MMKKIILLVGALFSLVGILQAQLVVLLQAPPVGFTYKPQLWNMVLTNTSGAPLTLHIELTLNDAVSSQQVLSGITRVFTLPVGTTMMNSTHVMPVQYNVTAASTVDASPLGLLPIGEFEACYHFFRHYSDNSTEMAEQCQEIRVEPLSPPQLIQPYDQTAIEEIRPQLSWLPPIPTQMFQNLRYDLALVEMLPNQAAADAITQNIPLYLGTNLTTNILPYPVSAPALEYDKTYAWRIIAKSNNNYVGASETWQFSLKQFGKLGATASVQPFVSLKKAPETAYAIFADELKFSYTNETGDTIWNAKIKDLSQPSNYISALDLDSIPLRPGQNLVNINLAEHESFKDKHHYQLEIFNSRNETWRVRFEFRKPEPINQ